ncbi:MAG: sodium:proton antiporter [Oscillospiraceae bacterium]|jgi:NhaP-type Na+/H+ or K+/H+ antiporter|nr:sodium:proton antiporter [Oscillospiraceae bacterium]
MLTALALLLLGGLSLGTLAGRLGLPRLVGMMGAGMLLGPHMLDLVDGSVLQISSQLRQMALVIILLKAGLSLRLEDLKRVGRPALLLSFLPAVFELLGVLALAPPLLGVSRMEAAVLGSVLGAVSPAVVVPRMVGLLEEGRGTNKGIPQMILAGASLDDVFVIVLFTAFTGMAQGGGAHWGALVQVPVAILLGLGIGAAAGTALVWLFRQASLEGMGRLLILLSAAFLLLGLEEGLKGRLPLSGLLGVMAMALVLARQSFPQTTETLKAQFGKLWQGAEILLFTLVGAAVDLRYTLRAGPAAVAVILGALAVRSVGSWLCTAGTALEKKERLYCVLAYLPKATVQAAIGGVPLALGLPCGELVLSAAVLAILLTAPLGAFAMDWATSRLLEREKKI